MSYQYERGRRDGRDGGYNPPHRQSALSELLFGSTKQERRDRQDYHDGRNNARRR